MSGFLEAFQKISDIAETNNAGLRPFGIALRRYCLRQRQITECLVTPLSDRLDEWRRTANQMDRDCVKELRKAKSELQRAILEAEKCKKRLRRKEVPSFYVVLSSLSKSKQALAASVVLHLSISYPGRQGRWAQLGQYYGYEFESKLKEF
ncbi:Metastasis suppressor protein [Echinococcus granulosus]|uniref:Metastasis suppressor protein n=1 Tax=Echinococcus granulosus TaxID=6210 RepID=W6UKM0_ECHGR|nr:Metastasis suppressor protein [Echinococcus granulosus]EUB61711.1 Metastasis suppressor protein [Echinococcus granulosus]